MRAVLGDEQEKGNGNGGGAKGATPKAPKSHPDSKRAVTVDLSDRSSRTLCDDMVHVTFPVTLEESYEQFELLRWRAGEWRPFVARGIRDKETKEVRPMDMGSMKLPFVVKPHVGADGEELLSFYPFTYLVFGKKGTKGKPPPVRNWSFVRYGEQAEPVRALYDSTFGEEMNHFICKLYRAPGDLNKECKSLVLQDGGGGGGSQEGDDGKEEEKKVKKTGKKKKKDNKSDSIDWHQDNGKLRKFRDLHPDTGFEDYVLYSRTSQPRWLQVYEPSSATTYNLLVPSGTRIVFTGKGNQSLWHAVPKDTRDSVGERISVVGRRMVTYYNWETRQVIRAEVRCLSLSLSLSLSFRFSLDVGVGGQGGEENGNKEEEQRCETCSFDSYPGFEEGTRQGSGGCEWKRAGEFKTRRIDQEEDKALAGSGLSLFVRVVVL